MDRSQCIMCGKVRFRKYLLYAIDLHGKDRWICSRPVAHDSNYIKIGNMNYLHSPCQLAFLKMQYSCLERQIANYQFSKNLFPLYNEIKQNKIVIPELTFLLQL